MIIDKADFMSNTPSVQQIMFSVCIMSDLKSSEFLITHHLSLLVSGGILYSHLFSIF